MKPEEGNTGVEKERIEKDAIQYEDRNPYDAIHSAYFMGAITEYRRNAALIAALKELIPIAEQMAEVSIDEYSNEEYAEQVRSAIERAKTLTEPKPLERSTQEQTADSSNNRENF